MILKGHAIEIVVIEPFEWEYGNITGVISSTKNDNRLVVKLSKRIERDKLENGLIELKPRYQGETFNNLLIGESIMVAGALITENSKEFEYLFIGEMKL